MDAVEERTAQNELLPVLSVLTTINFGRGEFICASQADVNGIFELINRDQEVTHFRNIIINEADCDGDDN